MNLLEAQAADQRWWKECARAGHYDRSIGIGTSDNNSSCITEERGDSVYAKNAILVGLRRMCLEQVLLLVYIHEGLSNVARTCANLSMQMAGESAWFDGVISVGETIIGRTQRMGDPWRSMTKA